jgi:hypothetical protein
MALLRVVQAYVCDLDDFRTSAGDPEPLRCRAAGVRARLKTLPVQSGLPCGMQQCRTDLMPPGRLPEPEPPIWGESLRRYPPDTPAPGVFGQIADCGARKDGRIDMLHRYTLAG